MGVTVHPLARRAVTYLAELGFPATEPNRHRGKALPYHLADAFELVTLEIAGQPVLLAIDQGAERSPAEIEQLMRKLDEMVETTAVYVTEILNSYDRKRLIERRVSFLVPRKQLYLPGLGMDLREHFGKPIERNQLSPSAQAMLIAILQHPSWTVELTATEVAEKLDYTPMTASRAARELAAAGLAELEKAPKGQIIALNRPPRDTWELALPHMRSPVQRVVYAKMFAYPPPAGLGDVVCAGMSALARRTMLAKDGLEVFACSRESWNGWKKWGQVMPQRDEGADEVQIWSYPPTLKNGWPGQERKSTAVDPLSLYLSLRKSEDPRVQLALDELMEQVWQ
ncbi:MarR family transcriptional regulator [Xanthomonas campestris pv. campestris]|uniref:helix-turn-helix domain-containing protein n=1 Tax=Xanthomonas campestris TaxID=339 RepID=UPI0023783442|nr:helix-turn-helix domain-containing protein [Xanthomonas campestris]WDL66303.1 MarR family transcriptional regulator [Xanthomonas campestris pv. campestris]